jgi:hypothetical protein
LQLILILELSRGSSGVEQLIRNQQVVGSNPILGSKILFLLIVSRPQTNTLISFALFLIITIVVTVMNLIVITRGLLTAWYNYAVVIVLVPIGLFVLYRIFIRYKILRLGDNKIQIEYPVLRQLKKYSLDQIVAWRENKVKTSKTSEYKELQILFTDKSKLTIGHKEHTEYHRMIQYLIQKAPKKRDISA